MMPSKASMNVSLTPELVAYVFGLVDSGQYRSASEVLRAGLRLLQREDTTLIAALNQGLPEATYPKPKPVSRERRKHG
jgi:antitoxin ParD1/3/4